MEFLDQGMQMSILKIFYKLLCFFPELPTQIAISNTGGCLFHFTVAIIGHFSLIFKVFTQKMIDQQNRVSQCILKLNIFLYFICFFFSVNFLFLSFADLLWESSCFLYLFLTHVGLFFSVFSLSLHLWFGPAKTLIDT